MAYVGWGKGVSKGGGSGYSDFGKGASNYGKNGAAIGGTYSDYGKKGAAKGGTHSDYGKKGAAKGGTHSDYGKKGAAKGGAYSDYGKGSVKGGGKAGWHPDYHDPWMPQGLNQPDFWGSCAGFSDGKSKGKKGVGKQKQAGGKQKQGAAPAAKKQKTLSADLGWKSRIQQAYGLKFKTPPVSTSLTYTCGTADEGGFVCILTCDRFEAEYASEEVFSTKKLAEESAAMAAVRGEFHEAYADAPESMKMEGALKEKEAANAAKTEIKKEIDGAAGGTKRKEPSSWLDGQASDPKSLLNSGVMILVDRSITKADMQYDIIESNGSSVATLTLHCFPDKKPVFKGKPVPGVTKDSKKQAEQNAAEAAWRAYKRQVEDKLPAHMARKEARLEEKKAEFHAKIIAKKEAEASEGVAEEADL